MIDNSRPPQSIWNDTLFGMTNTEKKIIMSEIEYTKTTGLWNTQSIYYLSTSFLGMKWTSTFDNVFTSLWRADS